MYKGGVLADDMGMVSFETKSEKVKGKNTSSNLLVIKDKRSKSKECFI